MENKFMIMVDINKFQQMILDCISSGKIDKFYNNTIFSDDPKCKQAMIHGMIIASMMTSKCSYTLAKAIDEYSDDKKLSTETK